MFIVKQKIYQKKENWGTFDTAEKLLEHILANSYQALYLFHSQVLTLDWDATKKDAHLAVKAARAIMGRLGLQEGKDWELVLTGGKGCRIWVNYYLENEQIKALKQAILDVAADTWIPCWSKPHIVKEKEQKIQEVRAEIEKIEKLIQATSDYKHKRELIRKKSNYYKQLFKLQDDLKKYKKGKIRADLFLDQGFLRRNSMPERILGLQTQDGKTKWARIATGKEVEKIEQYRNLCRVPTNPAKSLKKQAKYLLEKIKPLDQADLHVQDIIAKITNTYQHQIFNAKFDNIFNMLNKNTDEVLSQLITTEWGNNNDNNELEEFLLSYQGRTRIKNNVVGLVGPCPVCSQRDKAYLVRGKNGRWFLKCHRTSCAASDGIPLSAFVSVPKKKEKKVRYSNGLGSYLSPQIRNIDPSRDAQEVLELWAKNQHVQISWPLGAGKTTFALAFLEKFSGANGAISYAAQNWDQAREVAAALQKNGVPVTILPRKEDVCPNWEKVKKYREKGLADAHFCQRFCLAYQKDPTSPEREVQTCPIVEALTKQKNGVVIGVHQHLPFMQKWSEYVIIDEAHHLVRKEKINVETFVSLLQYFDISPAATKLIRYLQNIDAFLIGQRLVSIKIPQEIQQLAKTVYIRLLSEYDPKQLRPYKARFKMEENYKISKLKLNRYRIKDVLDCLKSVAADKATLTIQKGKKEIIYIDPSYSIKNNDVKLLLLSATAPPSLLKKALNIRELAWTGYVAPRKGTVVGVIPKSSTGKLAMQKPGQAVQNAREILRNRVDGVITYKECLRQAEVHYGLEGEKVITWGKHEGSNSLKDAQALVIEGQLIPSPSEISEHLALCSDEQEQKEMLFYLLVSPVLQAIGRCRRLWNDEKAVVFLMNRHFLQIQKFLISHLGALEDDFAFWATEHPLDTERKKIAIYHMLHINAGNRKQLFSDIYLRHTRSKQIRYYWKNAFRKIQKKISQFSNWYRKVTSLLMINTIKITYNTMYCIFQNRLEQFKYAISNPFNAPPTKEA
ncbi:MAG: hypothetical protein Q9M37_05900 [Desulfonauticus sp.]|nr:hypothetical protein [Desulfonauticus sp.]